MKTSKWFLVCTGLAAALLAKPLPGRGAGEAPSAAGLLGERVRIGGEAGAAFFDTGSHGAFPHDEFLIDEAKLFIDAKVLENVFFFTEVNLRQREAADDDVALGEIYVEVEDLQTAWNGASPLSLRAGRVDIPFGEEYLTRDAVDNPFINHTLADIWGVDEGVELFGRLGLFDYALAVQNGSYLKSRDGHADKSVCARAGVAPARGLRLSASAMRTGDLDVEQDMLSEVWFGNAYVSSYGSEEGTTTFHANLAQLDASYRWNGGHAAVAAGGIAYDDDDTAADNQRDATYWSAEAVQDVVGRFYAGARYSRIHSGEGFNVPGNADVTKTWHFLTDDLWRLSTAVGYRWSERLVWKAEYTWERGDRSDGGSVEGVDMIATEIACGF